MTIIDDFVNMMTEFFASSHAAVIHFPIVGILMSFAAGATAFGIKVLVDILLKREMISQDTWDLSLRYVRRFEFSSYILLILGILGYGIAGYTGFQSAGGVSPAIENTLLEYKVRLSIYTLFVLLTPLILKTYVGWRYHAHIFDRKHIILPILYLIPIIIGAALTAIIAGTGGKYVYGHSILETFGLGFLIPQG